MKCGRMVKTARHVVHWIRQMVTPPSRTADIMRVAREASTAATGRLVFELKAQGHHEGKDTLEKGFAITKQLHVGGFILEIDGDRPVFAGLARAVLRKGHPLVRWSMQMMTHDGGKTTQFQGDHEGCRGSTTTFGGMCYFPSADAPTRVSHARIQIPWTCPAFSVCLRDPLPNISDPDGICYQRPTIVKRCGIDSRVGPK